MNKFRKHERVRIECLGFNAIDTVIDIRHIDDPKISKMVKELRTTDGRPSEYFYKMQGSYEKKGRDARWFQEKWLKKDPVTAGSMEEVMDDLRWRAGHIK